jgi:hypothetical protein
VPLKVTAVVPLRFVPMMVTVVPVRPPPGLKELMVGELVAVVTVKLPELVAVPEGVVTLIGPLVAPLGTVTVICVAELTV